MRIDLAYCVELNKTIDIYQACLAFSQQEKFTKFHFLCSDPDCRNSIAKGVRVTAVNHQYLPEDDNIAKSPHYRKLDAHIETCEWVFLNTILDEPVSEEIKQSHQYKLSRKIKRLITRFIVPEDEVTNNLLVDELNKIRKEKDPEAKKEQLRSYIRGAGSTATSMESLVSCYEELKEANSLDENLTITGYGNTTFKQFFKQLKYATTDKFVILHGGARLYKRYGTGFSLSFLDKHDDKPVNLYISSEQIRNSHYGTRLKSIVDELERDTENKPYLKVYWLGGLDKNGKIFNVRIDSLSHIVFRIAYPKKTKIG